MVCHDNCFALKLLCELFGEPCSGRMVAGNEIVGPQAPVVVHPDVFEVVHPFLGDVASHNLVAGAREIRPCRRTQDSDAIEDQYLVFQNVNMRCSGITHLLEGAIDVAVVELMVSADIHNLAHKRFVCPFDAPRFFIDVTCQNY